MRIFSSNGDILWLALLLYTKVLFFVLSGISGFLPEVRLITSLK